MPPSTTRRRTHRRATVWLAAFLALCAGAVATLSAVGPLAGSGDATSGPGAAVEAGSDAARGGEAPSRTPAPAPAPDAGRPGDRASAARDAGGAAEGRWPEIDWRDSVAVGLPTGGELVRGVRLPPEGGHFFTWDPVQRHRPNRPWRRFGTDHAIRATLAVLADHRRAFPRAPRLGIGDLSRPRGGDFGTDYGPIGHASHQNGLDVDVYYPLEDGTERAPLSVEEIDLRLSQDLVDRFVSAGAEKVFVGPSTGLTGPPGIVQAIPNHDNHLHARFPVDG